MFKPIFDGINKIVEHSQKKGFSKTILYFKLYTVIGMGMAVSAICAGIYFVFLLVCMLIKFPFLIIRDKIQIRRLRRKLSKDIANLGKMNPTKVQVKRVFPKNKEEYINYNYQH